MTLRAGLTLAAILAAAGIVFAVWGWLLGLGGALIALVVLALIVGAAIGVPIVLVGRGRSGN